jgi:hypothetical protein
MRDYPEVTKMMKVEVGHKYYILLNILYQKMN